MKWLRKALIYTRNILLLLFALSLFFVIVYKFLPIYITPLMVIRTVEQMASDKKVKMEHKWVPLSDISQNLIQAVVASEDNRFLGHNGFDFEQIEIAQKEAEKGKKLRGASTITQQTAKNVFLWPDRSYFRKGLEVYFTVLIEFVWGKERIMEVYLNSIEMGNGIYGAEAVAQAHFHKHANALTVKEAALIAASLPNPRVFNSGKPSAYLLKRQSKIESLMGKIMKINFDKKNKPEEKNNKPSNKKKNKWRGST